MFIEVIAAAAFWVLLLLGILGVVLTGRID